MITMIGRLYFEDIGAGAWLLLDAEGQRWTLFGDIPRALDGVMVEATVRPAAGMSASMTGTPALAVEGLRPIG